MESGGALPIRTAGPEPALTRGLLQVQGDPGTELDPETADLMARVPSKDPSSCEGPSSAPPMQDTTAEGSETTSHTRSGGLGTAISSVIDINAVNLTRRPAVTARDEGHDGRGEEPRTIRPM